MLWKFRIVQSILPPQYHDRVNQGFQYVQWQFGHSQQHSNVNKCFSLAAKNQDISKKVDCSMANQMLDLTSITISKRPKQLPLKFAFYSFRI